MSINKLIAFVLFFYFVIFSYTVLAQTKSKSQIVITSKSLIADNRAKTAIFETDVKAVKGDITLNSDKMIVYYKEQDNKTVISRIDAHGNVSLIKADKYITSQNATYFADGDEFIEFIGQAKAADISNVVTGSKIIYFLKEEKTIVHDSKVFLTNKDADIVK